MPLQIRPATPADIPQILAFIRELALYEREPHSVLATEADLLRDGFGPTPRFRCVIADHDQTPAGFALFFTSYSTWRGHHGIRLEDLYVSPPHRGQGIGKALLAHLAQIALAEGCPRLEWDVLAWNQPAIDFYHAHGAVTLNEWRIMRIADDALAALARPNPRYRVMLICKRVPRDAGAEAATNITAEFREHRRWHTNALCSWDGSNLTLQVENDFDDNGLATQDEFSDCISGFITQAFDGELRVQEVVVRSKEA